MTKKEKNSKQKKPKNKKLKKYSKLESQLKKFNLSQLELPRDENKKEDTTENIKQQKSAIDDEPFQEFVNSNIVANSPVLEKTKTIRQTSELEENLGSAPNTEEETSNTNYMQISKDNYLEQERVKYQTFEHHISGPLEISENLLVQEFLNPFGNIEQREIPDRIVPEIAKRHSGFFLEQDREKYKKVKL